MGREYDMTQTGLSLGIDIGSTTAKAVLVEDGRILYEKYQRHFSQVRQKTLELLEEGEELSLCRHLETRRELYILNDYLRQGPGGLECEDSTDYRLPVSPGDLLTVVRKTRHGFLCKKEGVTGWYYGRLSDIME